MCGFEKETAWTLEILNPAGVLGSRTFTVLQNGNVWTCSKTCCSSQVQTFAPCYTYLFFFFLTFLKDYEVLHLKILNNIKNKPKKQIPPHSPVTLLCRCHGNPLFQRFTCATCRSTLCISLTWNKNKIVKSVQKVHLWSNGSGRAVCAESFGTPCAVHTAAAVFTSCFN